MHLKRSKASMKVPVPRKGTKYLARARNHADNGVPVVIAVRDMLGLAKNSKEVRYMINNKLLKINNREVKDIRESIKLFNILSADKQYVLEILPTGRFQFKETKESSRICKVIGKKILAGKKTQINLHDGTNLISKENVSVGDSVELGPDNKLKKIIKIDKGKSVFIISGGSIGLTGKIKELSGRKATVSIDGKDKGVELEISHILAR